jgi:hypothetical protein
MTRKPILRLAAVAILGLVLAGPARAAGPGTLSPAQVPEVLAAAWEWLLGLWGGADHGCDIDPNGRPGCAPVTAQADLGCNIDPNGSPRCTP